MKKDVTICYIKLSQHTSKCDRTVLKNVLWSLIAIGHRRRIVSELTGKTVENPYPEKNTDNEVAEEFADFFLSKILKIRQELENKLIYQPADDNIPNQFAIFQNVNKDEVKTSGATVGSTRRNADC